MGSNRATVVVSQARPVVALGSGGDTGIGGYVVSTQRGSGEVGYTAIPGCQYHDYNAEWALVGELLELPADLVECDALLNARLASYRGAFTVNEGV